MAAIIVGAGPGMGRAIAAAIGPAHGPVALVARRAGVLAEVTASLAARGVAAQAYPADITDDAALRNAVERARRDLGRFSVVVCNASLFVPGPPTQVRPAEFRIGLAVGLTAALVAMQATVDDLRAAAPRSSLLFTGSGLALHPWPDAIGLAIQKAGLRHLALAAAEELRPAGVSVSLVTIRGNLAAGTDFDPDRIAGVYADLATPGVDRPVEVTVTADGPDWRLRAAGAE